MDYTVFDTETTGLDPVSDRIIELAAIRVRAGGQRDEFHTLVDPERPVSEGAFRVNGISDAMLAGAPKIAEVVPRFAEFIRGSCLCSYNAPFDMGFLNPAYRMAGMEFPPETAVIDILAMARQLLQLERHPLWFVAQSLGFDARQEHRALSDVELTLDVFSALTSRLREQNVEALSEYVYLFGRGCLSHERMQQATVDLIQQAIEHGAALRMKYFSRSDSRVSERDVIPRALRQDRGRQFLAGFCCKKNDERTFRVDGILRAEIIEPGGIPTRGMERGGE